MKNAAFGFFVMTRKFRVFLRLKRSLPAFAVAFGFFTVLFINVSGWFDSDDGAALVELRKTAVILTLGSISPLRNVLDAKQNSLDQLSAQVLFDDILPLHFPHLYEGVIIYEGEFRDWFRAYDEAGVRLVPTSRIQERQTYGDSFELFSGIYGAPVKPAAIRWLAESGDSYRSAWCLEPDIVYTQPWHVLFGKYGSNEGDLVAFNVTFRHRNKTKWNHWRGCSFCRELPREGLQAAMLPIFRVSQRLAKAILTTLKSSSRSAHHEVLIPTFVTMHDDFTWTDLAPEVGYVEWRPIIDARFFNASQPILPGRLYHPIKSPEIFQKFIAETLHASSLEIPA